MHPRRTHTWLLALSLVAACVDDAARNAPRQQRAGLTMSPVFNVEVPPRMRGRGRRAWFRPTAGGTLVVWDELRFVMHAGVLDESGHILGGTDHVLIETAPSHNGVDVAPCGEGFVVVWKSRDLGVYVRRVGARGELLDARPMELAPPGAPWGWSDVVCNATRCAVSMPHDDGALALRLFTVDGRVLGEGPTRISRTAHVRSSVTALDDRFVLGWTEEVEGAVGSAAVRVAQVDLDGNPADPVARTIETASGARDSLRLASDGAGRVFASWNALADSTHPNALRVAVFDRNLTDVTPPTTHADLFRWNGEPWWDGAQWVLFQDPAFAHFRPDGTRLDVSRLDVSRPIEFSNGIVGGAYLWVDRELRRTTSDGTIVSRSEPWLTHHIDTAPSIDWNGAEYAVAWERDESVTHLARVSTAGVVRDAPSVALGRAEGDPEARITANPALTLSGATAHLYGTVATGVGHVAFDLEARTRAADDLFAAGASTAPRGMSVTRGGGDALLVATNEFYRLDADGMRADPMPTAVSSEVSRGAHADFDGAGYRLVYRSDVDGTPTMFTRALGPTGAFVGEPRSLAELGAAWSGPWIAWGGDAHLLVWIDAELQIRAARLGRDGAPAAEAPLTLGAFTHPGTRQDVLKDVEVSLAFDGINFVAVWSPFSTGKLLCVRVPPTGAVLDRSPLELADASMAVSGTPVIASAGRGNSLVVFSGNDYVSSARTIRGVLFDNDGAPFTPPGSDAGADAADGAGGTVTSGADAAATDADTDATAPDTDTDAALDGSGASDSGSLTHTPGIVIENAEVSRPRVLSANVDGGCAVRPNNTPARARLAPWTLAVAALLARRRRARR